MAATTTLLDLVTPTQGSLPGVWGDTVNYGITEYLDIAIAGTLTLTGDSPVTLANTIGSSAGTNIGSTTAQYAIIKVTGTFSTTKIITAPSYSKTYLVVNASSAGTVSFIRSGQVTAVSIATNETALVYYNGTDYVKVVGTATAGAAGGSTTQVQYNNAGVLAGITGATTNGTALTLVAPVLGTPASATLTLATGLPISTGVSGLGTGIATALAVNVGTAGAPVVNGGALGTPSGGTVTNLTGTASININGTVGATTAAAGLFTTLGATGVVTAGKMPITGGASTTLLSAVITDSDTDLKIGGSGSGTNKNVRIYSDGLGTLVGTFSSTGLAVTGTLSATGTLSGGTSGTAYSFSGSAPATSLTLTSGGDLGVGTTNPDVFGNAFERVLGVVTTGASAAINVSGASGARIQFGVGSTRYGVIYQDASNFMQIGTVTALPISFVINTTERMRLDTAGNLGLGVTPVNAYTTFGYKNYELPLAAFASFDVGLRPILQLKSNVYYNSGGSTKYISSGHATQYTQDSGEHIWSTAASGTANNAVSFTQAMTLDASGNLGIGTTTPLTKVESRGTPDSNWGNAVLFDNRTVAIDQGGVLAFGGYKTTTTSQATFAQIAGRKENATAGNEAGYLAFIINNNTTYVEGARIDSSGNLLVGTTSALTLGKVSVEFNGTNNNGIVFNDTVPASGVNYALFQITGTTIGSIARVAATSAVVYNTTSDQRLKSNIVDANSVLEKLMDVKVRQYDWTEGDLHQDYGFIAQEIEPVLSGVVTKGKTDADMWQLDYSRLTPHLLKAIQEQQALITQLTARITALETA